MKYRSLIIRSLLFCSSFAILLYIQNLYHIVYQTNKHDNVDTKEINNNESLSKSSKQGLIVVTRVHMKSANEMPDPMKVVTFIENCQTYATMICICIGSDSYPFLEVYINSIKNILKDKDLMIHIDNINFLPIIPWGYYTTSLNAAIIHAQDNQFSYIAFQSLELKISSYEVEKIVTKFNSIYSKTIVIGPELDGHEFKEGIHKNKLSGRKCPWNTFAIWNVHLLGLIGFPLIGDGVMNDRSIAGVEELSTISLLQRINPQLNAYLIRIQKSINQNNNIPQPQQLQKVINWNTNFDDNQRKEYHQHKMESKDKRPLEQIKYLGIKEGTIIHEII